MRPGLCNLAVCPHCGGKKELLQLISGNTFGEELWSDSKRIAPMLPRLSPIQKCPVCGHFYELEMGIDDMEVGEERSFEKGWLSFEDALKAYDEICSESEEKREFMTQMVVWSYNDMLREIWGDGIPFKLRKKVNKVTEEKTTTSEQYQKFRDIVSLGLKKNFFKDNLILQAELYREIEEFDTCIKIIKGYKPENEFMKNIIDDIVAHAQNKDKKVFKILQ